MTPRPTPHEAARARPDSVAAVRPWPSEPARAWTLGLVTDAKRIREIVALVASGSAIRDVERSDDIDLVLVYRDCRPVLARRPIDVDLRQYEQTEVVRKLKTGHDYLSWTVRYGHVLFERSGWWSRLREEWQDRLLPPSADDARARAQRAASHYARMRDVGDHDAAAELSVLMLTHLARAALSDAGVLPQSRPELVGQLRGIGEDLLADRLAEALSSRYG